MSNVKLLVIPEKCGTCYFVYETKEQKHKAFVQTVQRRIDEGWYDHYFDEEYKEELCNRLRAKVEPLPDNAPDWMKVAYDKAIAEYNKALRDYGHYKADREMIQKAIAGDGLAAKYIVEKDTDVQYQGAEVME